mmetsp:Transcript_29112/g.95030  ORF Transcript_29112/g.95030 Transcript_29112/m.95030 type:complete len:448 (-) Transcript_29112:94-1437(-)
MVDFKEKAVEFVKQAVAEDEAGNYDKALKLYTHGLEYLSAQLKYEKNPRLKETLRLKFMGYLKRAEEIKGIIATGPSKEEAAAPAGGAAQKAKPSGGGGQPGAAGAGAGGGGEVDSETQKLRGALGGAILTETPNVQWSDVAGLDSAKEALKEAVILPVQFPQFFTGNRKAWSGFLLYGPPGTGKSYLAKAVATEAKSTFFSVSSSDLVSKWMGESERLVNQLFTMAREQAPSIIFIDEIDSLCGARGESGESEAARRIKTEILVQMQGVGNDRKQVLVLAATNTPYNLDQAVRRRFDKRIYIPLPDQRARMHMFKVHIGDTPHALTPADFEMLGERTESFSGSDVSVAVKDVLFEPVRKTQEATHFKAVRKVETGEEMYEPCSPGDPAAFEATLEGLAMAGHAEKVAPPKIVRGDFERVLLRARPTVSTSDLDVFTRFTTEFGEQG